MALIGLPVIIEEFILTAIIVFITTLIYKFLINQGELRQLKASLKEKQSKMKELQKTNPEEAKKVMSETLSLSNKQFRMTMKPMLVTLVIFFVAWPILGEAYGDKTVKLENNIGILSLDGMNYSLEFINGKIRLDSIDCSIPCDEQTIGSYKWNIYNETNSTVKFSRIVALLPFSLPFLENDLGWLMWYIINSIVLSFVFRKILGVEL